MKRSKNPKNDRKLITPKTSGSKSRKDDKKFTSYDTSREETSTPQNVREGIEPEGEQAREKKSKWHS